VTIGEDNEFTLNSAVTGGAIYFGCDASSSLKCSYVFRGNKCRNNAAITLKDPDDLQFDEGAGGCFYTDLYEVTGYLQNSYSGNEARYGENFAAYPYIVQRLSSLTPPKEAVGNFKSVSGQTIKTPIIIILKDFFEQVVNTENSAIGFLLAPTSKNAAADLTIQ